MPAKTAKGSPAGEERVTRYPIIKVRLYPTAEQAALMDKTFGCCRYLWNRMLADVQEFYAATDMHFIPTPARYKKEAPFLTEVDSQALCTVHQNLRKAFLNFFRAPSAFGYPQFKTKKAKKDTFTVYCREYRTGPSIYLTQDGVQMPKLGHIRAKLHRRPQPGWLLRYVTVTKSRSGSYYCSIVFRCEAERPRPITPTPERTVGINHSLTHLYVDSSGNSPDMPVWFEKAKEKLNRMNRRLSRMEQGSKNYAKQQQKIRLLHEHIANQRKDFIHKESRRIANAWDAVCVRDTDLVRLSKKVHHANVMDSGFGMFRECLKYKLEQQGKPFIVVGPYMPTAKTCHACGCVHDALNRREKLWICPSCGAAVPREVNAARNIRDWGLRQLFEQETGASGAVS